MVGCCGCGDEISVSIKFGETFDLVSNYFVEVLTTNFILWTHYKFMKHSLNSVYSVQMAISHMFRLLR